MLRSIGQSTTSTRFLRTLPSCRCGGGSIKPGNPDDRGLKLRTSADRVPIENFTLKELIAYAYDLKSDSQVLGGPDWLDKKHFDIAAKADDTELAKLKAMRGNEIRNEWGQMMQSLLIDRFVLKVRRDRRTIPGLCTRRSQVRAKTYAR